MIPTTSVQPQGPAEGRLQVGDIIASHTECPVPAKAPPNPRCRLFSINRQHELIDIEIEGEVLPVQIYFDLRDAPYATAWLSINTKSDEIRLGITTGLIGIAVSDDELAFVVGHELGHLFPSRLIYPRPPIELLRRMANAVGTSLPHEREMEADRFALHLAQTAGYRPDAGLTVITRLSTMHEAKAYNQTHPPADVRLAAMREALTEFEKADSSSTSSGG